VQDAEIHGFFLGAARQANLAFAVIKNRAMQDDKNPVLNQWLGKTCRVRKRFMMAATAIDGRSLANIWQYGGRTRQPLTAARCGAPGAFLKQRPRFATPARTRFLP
jgi:hypothetical protein